MHDRRLPFEIIVSRLLSNPCESAFHLSLTLLDTLSDLDLYSALDEEYHPYSHYTLKQCYYASVCSGATRVALFCPAGSTALRPFASRAHNWNSGLAPPFSLAATGGIPFWFLFLDLLIWLSSVRGLARHRLRLGLAAARRGVAPTGPTLYRTRACALRYSRIDNSHRAEARRHKFRSVLRSSSMSKPRDPLLLFAAGSAFRR